MNDRVANFLWRTRARKVRKIRPEETADSLNHVAARAFGFAVEKRPSCLWISGQRGGVLIALQRAEVLHNSVICRGAERPAQRWHRHVGRTVAHDVRQFLVGEPRDFRICSDIRAALPPRPSKPWHPAQFPPKFASRGHRHRSLISGFEVAPPQANPSATTAPAVPTITTPANTKALLHRCREGPLNFDSFDSPQTQPQPDRARLEEYLRTNLQDACRTCVSDLTEIS